MGILKKFLERARVISFGWGAVCLVLGMAMSSATWAALLSLVAVSCFLFAGLDTKRVHRFFERLTRMSGRRVLAVVVVLVVWVLGLMFLGSIKSLFYATGRFGEDPHNRYVRVWSGTDSGTGLYYHIIEWGVRKRPISINVVGIDVDTLAFSISTITRRWYGVPDSSRADTAAGDPDGSTGPASGSYSTDAPFYYSFVANDAIVLPGRSFYVGFWDSLDFTIEDFYWNAGDGKRLSVSAGTLELLR